MKNRNINHRDDWKAPKDPYDKLDQEFHFDLLKERHFGPLINIRGTGSPGGTYFCAFSKYNRMESKCGRLTRQGAWGQVKRWGVKYLNCSLHPHMLRHGLAIYLLAQGVPVAVIAARLGHSSVSITQNAYLVITPELQRQMTAHVPMR